jgi:hypothetical protein
MRRITERIARTTVHVLLFAGCADNDTEPAFTAPQGTDGATTTTGEMSTSATGTGGESSTGAAMSTGMTGAVSGSTSGVPTTTGDGGETSTGGTDETTGTTTTGATGETGTSTGTTGEDTAGAPSFMIDIWPIFDDRCSCHQDSNGAGKLRLAMEDAYTNMIDMPSHQAPMLMLVKPGSAEDSYLWHKLNDTQDDVGGSGKKMPPGGKLKMPQLELIQQWIDGGAKP